MSDFTTAQAIEALHKRHPQSEGKFANVVEFMRIDFLSVGVWKSTGFVVNGYEIKVSRGDWLKELKDPLKSAENMRRVDHWWLAAPTGVVKSEEEIPDGWGYLRIQGNGSVVVIEAPRLRPAVSRVRVSDAAAMYAEREAFAGLARRYAYAEADRAALHSASAIVDTEPALAQAALSTGRWTNGQKAAKAAFDKQKTMRRKQAKREQWERRNETGW